MAIINGLTSGSPLIGNPVTFSLSACEVSNTSSTLAYHGIKIKVYAALICDASDTMNTSDAQMIGYEISSPTENLETHIIDVSSALRAVADKYKYSHLPITYPKVKWYIEAWDEYMLNGQFYTNIQKVRYPAANNAYMYSLLGKYTDMERLLSGNTCTTKAFSRKPHTLPQIVCVGETYAYTPDLANAVSLGNDITPPTSLVKTITKAGLNTVNGYSLNAMPATYRKEDRYEFRFINGLGTLESFSCTALAQREVTLANAEYTVADIQTFGTPSHSIIRKHNDISQIKMTSGPLDTEWAEWLVHEFLMASHCWVYIRGASKWVRCHIKTDDTINIVNRAKTDIISIDFTCVPDIAGSLSANMTVLNFNT